MTIQPFDKPLSHCPLCQAGDFKGLADWSFKGIALHYDMCSHCGFVFQNPTYSAAAWSAFYRADYRNLYNENSRPVGEVLRVQQERARHYAGWLKPRLGSVRRHLDIGASAGVFLKEVKSQLGAQSGTGIEPGDDYRNYARENGFELFSTLDELIATRPEKYDLISLCHVLEHIPDFVAFLTKIRESLIADSGSLFIEVPNIRGAQSFEVAHPNCFSLKTLSDALEMAGFEVALSQEHGMPRTAHPESRIYLSTLSKPSDRRKTAPEPAGEAYLNSSLNHIRKGFTHDSWLLFWIKHPFRRLTGRYPL